MKSDRAWLLGLMLPCAAVFLVFFVIPLTRLLLIGGSGELGWAAYSAAFTEPRYLRSMLSTVALSAQIAVSWDGQPTVQHSRSHAICAACSPPSRCLRK